MPANEASLRCCEKLGVGLASLSLDLGDVMARRLLVKTIILTNAGPRA